MFTALLVAAAVAHTPMADPPATESSALLARARPLLVSHSRTRQLAGTKLLKQAYEGSPGRLETVVGMAQAYFVRAYWAESRPAKQRRLAKKGVQWAKRAVSRWPQRAEGYYWAAANFGMVATASGVLAAVQQGLAGKIEQSGLAALKRNPTLYRGAVPRLLGRYYQMLPWPLKRPKRALELLEEAHRLDPDHVAGQQYLAEGLHDSGARARARALFERCSRGKGPARDAPSICRDRLLH